MQKINWNHNKKLKIIGVICGLIFLIQIFLVILVFLLPHELKNNLVYLYPDVVPTIFLFDIYVFLPLIVVLIIICLKRREQLDTFDRKIFIRAMVIGIPLSIFLTIALFVGSAFFFFH